MKKVFAHGAGLLAAALLLLTQSAIAADPLFAGKLDDVEFLPYALTDAKVLALTTNTPPHFAHEGAAIARLAARLRRDRAGLLDAGEGGAQIRVVVERLRDEAVQLRVLVKRPP